MFGADGEADVGRAVVPAAARSSIELTPSGESQISHRGIEGWLRKVQVGQAISTPTRGAVGWEVDGGAADGRERGRVTGEGAGGAAMVGALGSRLTPHSWHASTPPALLLLLLVLLKLHTVQIHRSGGAGDVEDGRIADPLSPLDPALIDAFASSSCILASCALDPSAPSPSSSSFNPKITFGELFKNPA